MEQVGNEGGGRWQICRADLYLVAFFCLTNYMPMLRVSTVLKMIVVSMSNLEGLDFLCCSLYGFFLIVGLVISLLIRIREIWPRLEIWTKVLLGELSVVAVLCCWIIGMDFWLWVRTQGAECRTSADGPLMNEYCNRAVFKLSKELSKYNFLEWTASLPNWILTVSAGIYGCLAVREFIKENAILREVCDNRSPNPEVRTSTEDNNGMSCGTSMADIASLESESESDSDDRETITIGLHDSGYDNLFTLVPRDQNQTVRAWVAASPTP